MDDMTREENVREAVRDRYATAARVFQTIEPTQGGCCGGGVGVVDEHGNEVFGAALYDTSEAADDTTLTAMSLGCGVPTKVADLKPGEVVLDLGSGAGGDVLIAARRVGPSGRAIGLDMTDEMLAVARENAARHGVSNVDFVKGYIEQVPLGDDTVDVVISNCVINLAADKGTVLREAARVLRPGGRLAVSDVVADEGLTDELRADMMQWTGCISGALTREQYEHELSAAGFVAIEIEETHRVHEHAAAAIVRASLPAGAQMAHQ